jgi:F-type H+-transporting ATPase subunit c
MKKVRYNRKEGKHTHNYVQRKIMDGIFYAKAAAFIGAAITMGFGSLGPALGQGIIGMKACENIGKYPESAGQVRTTMLLAMMIVESSAVYCLIVSGCLLFFGYQIG